MIGDAPNYYLGLTQRDRTKKLAFHTVKLLAHFLGADTITVADAELTVSAADGQPGQLQHHLFRRRDGRQLLVVWDTRAAPTVRATLRRGGATAVEYALDGTPAPYRPFDGHSLTDIRLAPGIPRMFEIVP